MQSEEALRLAQTARYWRVQSPAREYLGVEDPVRAFLLDEALALRHQIAERRATARDGGREKLPPGLRYADGSDFGDADELREYLDAMNSVPLEDRLAQTAASAVTD